MRIEGWESQLAEHIQQAYRDHFEWGRTDCALWSAEWVRKCTGQDYLENWIGRYRTEIGAARLMKRRGFASVEAIADRHLPVRSVAQARRGDLVLHPQGHLGICSGKNSVFLTLQGVVTMNTLDCPKAWQVG